jgi:glycosyltransferase involved in cell wall biosynthesis
MNPVTILIPVGPQPAYLQWLPEAIESVMQQTQLPSEILLISDGADISLEFIRGIVSKYAHAIEMFNDRFTLCPLNAHQMMVFRLWKTPWNIGFAQAFNCGVGLAEFNNIVYLASDDRLMPTAIEDCLQTWHDNNEKDAWYALSYQVGSDVYTIPNNAAMITRALWGWLKGYPPSAFAGPDALALSRLMITAPDRIIKVKEKKANYWVREHPYQDTKRQFSFFAASGIMEVIRDMETRRFEPDTSVVLK